MPAKRKTPKKPVAVTPKPIGRPSDYNPAFCDQIIELGRKGKSVVQMACEFDVVKQTLFNWQKDHPEFLDAFTRAKQLSQDWWENTAQTAMLAPGFNAAVWSRSMAARFPDDYTEKTKTELTGANGGGLEVRVAQMTPDERRAEIQRLLTQNPALNHIP